VTSSPEALAQTHAAAFAEGRAWTAKEFSSLLQSRGAILCGDVRSFILCITRQASQHAASARITTQPQMVAASALISCKNSFRPTTPVALASILTIWSKGRDEVGKFNGAERWAEETGGSYAEVEIQSDAQREQAIRRFAETGANPIVMAGFAWASALEEVAADYPDTKFQIIDMVVDAPNVRSIVFSEEQGSYLVGMLAAMASETNTVVDANQNYLHPGEVLTSMLKRVDNAVYDAMTAGTALEAGFNVMDLSNGGVGYAVDEFNEALITPEMTAALETAQAAIVAGEISVHNYNSDETCPAYDF